MLGPVWDTKRAAGERPGRPGLGGGWRCAVGQAQEEAAGKVLEAQELAVNDLAKSSPGARADPFALVPFFKYIYIYILTFLLTQHNS